MRLIKSTVILLPLFISVSSYAQFMEKKTFSECLTVRSGGESIVFILDAKKFSSTTNVFEFLSGLQYIGLDVSNITTHGTRLRDAAGKFVMDANGATVSIDLQRVTATVPSYNSSAYVSEHGDINRSFASKLDQSIDELRVKYPGLLSTECVLVPGPGGRVGG